MKILFLNAYFAPETIAFTHLESDLISGLLAEGHEITVLCPTPSRAVSAEVRREYKKKKHESLFDGRVTVQRFNAPKEGRNPIIRALRYFWCNARERRLARRYKGTDVVFAVSTPPTQGLLAGKAAKRLGCPFLYSLQDVFPDSLVTTGLAKKGSLLWKIGRKIENKTYARAHKIVVISEAIKKNLLDKGVSEDKLAVIPNWIDTDAVRPIPAEENHLYEEFGIAKDKFTVLYAGNMGAAQGADVILDAAELLKDNADIQFVIFGGGAGFDAAKARAEELPNVFIHPLLPQSRVPEVYSLGDLALITCKKGTGTAGMPSKTWTIMACGTPVLAAFDTDSELAHILAKASAGKAIEPQNAQLLADEIRAFAVLPREERPTGGRAYVEANASRTLCVEKYADLFETGSKTEKK